MEILIDGERVAVVRADRLDPKLVELGEGDGAYAFALVLPSAVRDGRPHTFEAYVRDAADPFRLKSKVDSFTVPVDAALPTLEIAAVDWTGARGRLVGGQFGSDIKLELWCGPERIASDLATTWSGRGRAQAFSVRFPVLAAGDLSADDWRLAAPGMAEAGLGAALSFPRIEGAGWFEGEPITFTLRHERPMVAGSVEARLYDGRTGELLQAQPISDARGAVKMAELDLAGRDVLRLSVAWDGVEPGGLAVELRRRTGRYLRNGSFRQWSLNGPRDWTAGAASSARGFNAFPPSLVAAEGATGDFIRIEAAEETSSALLSADLIAPVAADQPIDAALLVRTDQPARVTLAITDPAGVELGRFETTCPGDWTWRYGEGAFRPGLAAAQARLELRAEALDRAGPLTVDVAGVRLGRGGFDDGDVDEIGADDELVVNAALSDWPRGVVVDVEAGRTETARGWFVLNRRAPAQVHVRPWLTPEAPDRVGLLCAASEVSTYCRVEVLLDGPRIGRLRAGRLRFTAGSPPEARRLLGDSATSVPEHGLIERVFIVRRERTRDAGGFQLQDRTLGVVARRLLLTRSAYAFDLPVRLATGDPATGLAWAEDDGETEHFLVFEFRQAFATALSEVSLREGDREPERVEPYLELEDRSIAAQARNTTGLEAWVAPRIAAPASAAPAEGGAALKWTPGRAVSGSVEVVVCVYNAVDETLACLQALAETTEVPHTVHVIDDASEPLAAARLAAYAADKPWIRVTRHTENLGYTRSADEGVRGAQTEWVVLLNSDTVVTPRWLEGLLEAAASDSRTAFVGPVSNAASFQSVPEVYGPDNQFAVNALPPGWSPADMAALVAETATREFPETPLLNGFCTLMRRSVFMEVGGFNAAAFPAGYGEENDLCTRVVKAGYSLRVAEHVYVHHAKSASFGRERRAELAKAGGQALRALHPDVDYAALTAGFRDLPALVQLRAGLKRRLQEG